MNNLEIIFIFLLFSVPLFLFIKEAIKFLNPYKLIMIFGKPGSGKSTLEAKLALLHLKKWNVYTTDDLNIPGVRKFDIKNYGKYTFPKNSVLFLDEVGLIWDNRNFKAFKDEHRDFFKKHRHHKVKIYLFSQTFDVDKKIRDITDYMFMCRNIGPTISIAHRISRKLVVVEPTGDSEGRIADGYQLEPLWLLLLGMKITYVTYIPKYVKYFDSFEIEDGMQEMPYVEVPFPEQSTTRDDASPIPYISLKTLLARNRPRLNWRRAPKGRHDDKDADTS